MIPKITIWLDPVGFPLLIQDANKRILKVIAHITRISFGMHGDIIRCRLVWQWSRIALPVHFPQMMACPYDAYTSLHFPSPPLQFSATVHEKESDIACKSFSFAELATYFVLRAVIPLLAGRPLNCVSRTPLSFFSHGISGQLQRRRR